MKRVKGKDLADRINSGSRSESMGSPRPKRAEKEKPVEVKTVLNNFITESKQLNAGLAEAVQVALVNQSELADQVTQALMKRRITGFTMTRESGEKVDVSLQFDDVSTHVFKVDE